MKAAVVTGPGGTPEYADFADARRQIGRFIDAVYNVKRIHSSLGYLTPKEFEMKWTSAHKRAKKKSA